MKPIELITRPLHAAMFGAGLYLASVVPSILPAQTVTLSTEDGRINLTGELLQFADGQYRIKTAMGEMHLRADAVTCDGPGCPSDVVYLFGEPVTLQTKDQTVKVSGTLLDVVDNEFVIDVRGLGEVRLGVSLTDCTGPGCPGSAPASASASETTLAALTEEPEPAKPNTPEAEPPEQQVRAGPLKPVRISGSEDLGVTLIPYLIVGFGQYIGAEVSTAERGQDGFRVGFSSEDGNDIGEGAFLLSSPSDAFVSFGDGFTNLVALSRPATDDERRAARADLEEIAIAYDALTIAMHPSNPVQRLTLSQVAQIYSGDITDWAQVGGRRGPIALLYPEVGTEAYAFLRSNILQDAPAGGIPSSAITIRSLSQMAQILQSDPNAIGLSRRSDSSTLKHAELVGSCGLPFDQSAFSVKAGEYPLARRVFLYARSQDLLQPATREFLKFMETDGANNAISQSDLLNPVIERRTQSASRIDTLLDGLSNQTEQNLANALGADLVEFDRLSTTIRFASGSFDLSANAQADLRRLVGYLDELKPNTQVAVVGFADSSGGFDNNALLSKQRADTVAAALRTSGGAGLSNVSIVTRGYGELTPVACNTDATGRVTNRRVEIWVSKDPA